MITREKIATLAEEEKILQILLQGGVIIYPTETVLGLMGMLSSERALKKLSSLKKREGKPFQLLILPEHLTNLADIPLELAEELTSLIPGELTIVLPAKMNSIPPHAVDRVIKDGYIGLRSPNYPPLLKLLRELPSPLVATSANLPGEPPARSIHEAFNYFGDEVDLYISPSEDWEPSSPSTVVRITRELNLEVLREGPFDHLILMEILERLKGKV